MQLALEAAGRAAYKEACHFPFPTFHLPRLQKLTVMTMMMTTTTTMTMEASGNAK